MSFWFFFCRHKRTTFPRSPRDSGGKATVTCLDCTKEFEYDWETMTLGKERKADGKDQVSRAGQRRAD
jgi:hypothetical protein